MNENFYDSKGNFFMVRCPKCLSENWAPAVATGVCAWCGFDHNHGVTKKSTKVPKNKTRHRESR